MCGSGYRIRYRRRDKGGEARPHPIGQARTGIRLMDDDRGPAPSGQICRECNIATKAHDYISLGLVKNAWNILD